MIYRRSLSLTGVLLFLFSPGLFGSEPQPSSPVNFQQVQSSAGPAGNPTIIYPETQPGMPWTAVGVHDAHPDYTGVMGGASLYFLKPYLQNNTAFITTTGLGTPAPAVGFTEFDYNYEPAFATWLGWTNPNGFGARVRYFHFDQSADTLNTALTLDQAATTVISPPANLGNLPGGNFGTPGIVLGSGLGEANLNFDSDLQLNVWDFEGVWACRHNCFSMLFSGGARYLHMAQNYNATLFNQAEVAGATITETQWLSSGHNFNGAGPTLAWLGRYEFGTSGLAAFGQVRGALLVDRGRQNVAFFQEIVDPTGLAGGNQILNPSSTNSFDRVLPILELELGLEYGVNVGNSRVFLRGAAVNQTYFDAGNASGTDGNLSLFGGMLSAGVNY